MRIKASPEEDLICVNCESMMESEDGVVYRCECDNEIAIVPEIVKKEAMIGSFMKALKSGTVKELIKEIEEDEIEIRDKAVYKVPIE